MWDPMGRRSDEDEGMGMLGVGLLVGVIAGAAAALLMAPARGSDTRKLLRRNARKFAKQSQGVIGDTWTDAERAARVGLKRARKQAALARAAARDAADSGRRRFGLD